MGQTLQDYQSKVFLQGKDNLPYRILYPENYSPEKKYPLIVVLHGAGERGSDNNLQLTHGADLFIKENIRKDFPAIVVFPQCPVDDYWANVKRRMINGKPEFDFQTSKEHTKTMSLLISLINTFLSQKDIDTQRFYLGGISMGAMGTYELLRHIPEKVTAAFTICGGDNVENVKHYAKVPIWIFHGEKDDVVSVNYSKDIATELKSLNGKYKLTLYPDVYHDSWVQAFSDPELIPWLFSWKK